MNAVSLMNAIPGMKGMTAARPTTDSSMKDSMKEPSRGVESRDIFMLSPSAKQMADFFALQEAADQEAGNFDASTLKTQGDGLADLLKIQLASFQNSLIRSLQGSGVDLTEPINLQADNKSGNIEVTNAHPDALKIEQVFKKNIALADQFREISALAEVVNMRNNQLKTGDVNKITPMSVGMQYFRNSIPSGSERFNLMINAGKASYHF